MCHRRYDGMTTMQIPEQFNPAHNGVAFAREHRGEYLSGIEPQ